MLVFWVLFVTVIHAQRNSNIVTWQKEANISLVSNIRMNCKTEVVPGLSMPVSFSNTFYVSTSYPSRGEMNLYQKLLPSLTKANNDIKPNAIHKGYGYDKWAGEKNERWEVPRDHVGQNRSNCYDMTALAGDGHILDLYQSYKSVNRAFYLLRNTNAVIHPSGSTAFNCGYFMGYEGCETRFDQAHDWWNKCRKTFADHLLRWEDIWSDTASSPEKHAQAMFHIRNCSIRWDILDQKELNGSYIYAPKHYKRVFVISAIWDYNYHHFIADSLARLSRHLKFIHANPDIYIHLRIVEEYEIRSVEFKRDAHNMRMRLLQLLGIPPSRIVWGIILAEEVYIPRNLHCAYTLSNPMEIRLLAKELLHGAKLEMIRHNNGSLAPHSRELSTTENKQERMELYIDPKSGVKRRMKKKNLIVQQRYTSWGSSDRDWDDKTFDTVANAFALQYPNHTLIKISSKEAQSADYCMGCEMVHFSNADIFVAAHGAGMTNIMFMHPNSMVVEIFGDIKDVNMPYCGYYGPLSAVVGAHHFLYSYNHHIHEELNASRTADIARQSYEFYNILKTKVRSEINSLVI